MNIKQVRKMIDDKLIFYRDIYGETFTIKDVLFRIGAEQKGNSNTFFWKDKMIVCSQKNKDEYTVF